MEGPGFVTHKIKMPERRQLQALRDIEHELAKVLRAIRDEAKGAIDWAERDHRDARRYVRIKELAEGALEFQHARKRKAKTDYAKERGSGLERWEP